MSAGGVRQRVGGGGGSCSEVLPEPWAWAQPRAGSSGKKSRGQHPGCDWAGRRCFRKGVAPWCPSGAAPGLPQGKRGLLPCPRAAGVRPEGHRGHRALLRGVRASGEWGWVTQLLSTFLSIAYKRPRYTWKHGILTVCFHSFVLFHLTVYGTACPVLLFLVAGSS